MRPCVPGRIGIWKSCFLTRGKNWSTWRKTPRSKRENQQQTKPTFGVAARIWARATLKEVSCFLTTATSLLPKQVVESITPKVLKNPLSIWIWIKMKWKKNRHIIKQRGYPSPDWPGGGGRDELSQARYIITFRDLPRHFLFVSHGGASTHKENSMRDMLGRSGDMPSRKILKIQVLWDVIWCNLALKLIGEYQDSILNNK